MKRESRRFVCAICSPLALGLLLVVASAQAAGQQCSDMQMIRNECGSQQSKANKQVKQAGQFSNAKRKEPADTSVNAKDAKGLNLGLEAANAGDSTVALKELQPIADSNDNPYAKAKATLGLAIVKYHGGDIKGAIALQKQALDSNALDNDSYFQGLQTLAQMYIADEDYNDALTTLNTWNAQSGAQSADIYALQGNAYYRLQKYPEAVAAIQKAKSLTKKPQPTWDQVEMASYFAMDKYDDAAKLAEAALAKDPNNSTLLQNVIAIYINANQNKKALALLERAHANGQIKDEAGYINMAKMYDSIGQSSSNPKTYAMKAVAILKEGMDKGIVQPGLDGYKLLGDSYNIAGDYKSAAEAYAKAAPDAKTGEIDFKRAVMLDNVGRYEEARGLLKQSITKGGFQHMGQAYLALGNTELALKNKTAARTAYEHAAKDPEAHAEAQQALKRLGHK